MRRLSSCAGALYLVVMTACGRDVTFVDPRAATEPGDTTNGGGRQTVVRGNLHITVTVAAEDTAIAGALGLGGPGLPGATVTVRRLGQPLHQALTDSAGRVSLPGLVTGPWAVTAVRVLTAEERATLPAGAEDVTGFAAGASVTVIEAGTVVEMPAYAGRGGSVVINEVFPVNLPTDGNSYNTAQYIELVNNGFETVYLDGMIVGFTYHSLWESNVGTCEETRAWREDSLGVWARFFGSFPGGGQSYPLTPGEAVVVATDAVDHSQFFPVLPNLSARANFEFIGSSDVDNPAVPNMLNTGVAEWGGGVIGHGLLFSVSALHVFVAAPLDPDTLLSDILIPNWKHVRIPRGAVLDVFTSRRTPELEAASALVPCSRTTHSVFDLQHAELFDYTQPISIRRRVFQALGDGRVLLLRTRNSRVDFETAPTTPGQVP
jgi:hypothetical protein